MGAIRLLVLAIVLLLPLARAWPTTAQDATPAAAASTWVDLDLDLAAMLITPGQLDALGFPGEGKFFNGWYFPGSHFAEGTANFYGQPLEKAQALMDTMGTIRGSGFRAGLPSVPGDHESDAKYGIYMDVVEYTNPDAADALLDFITQSATEPGALFTVAPAPFALGDGALVVNYVYPDSEENYHDYALVFRTGDLYVNTGFWAYLPADSATPAATPVAGDSALQSPVATLAELEALGKQALANIEAVRAGQSPNLPALVLRLGDPLEATANYTEGYRLLNGEVQPYYGDRQDDIIADPAMLTGATAAYELEEQFQRNEDEYAAGDVYLVTRLFAFPDDAAATAFMASRPDALATGGMAAVETAAPEMQEVALPGQATDLGDESLAFSFVRSFTDDPGPYAGYDVYVRVGDTVAVVSLEGPADMPLDVAASIAEAQAACLRAGACPDAIPVPDAILEAVAADATPVAATPAA